MEKEVRLICCIKRHCRHTFPSWGKFFASPPIACPRLESGMLSKDETDETELDDEDQNLVSRMISF